MLLSRLMFDVVAVGVDLTADQRAGLRSCRGRVEEGHLRAGWPNTRCPPQD
jgi:hypothetical protein